MHLPGLLIMLQFKIETADVIIKNRRLTVIRPQFLVAGFQCIQKASLSFIVILFQLVNEREIVIQLGNINDWQRIKLC